MKKEKRSFSSSEQTLNKTPKKKNKFYHQTYPNEINSNLNQDSFDNQNTPMISQNQNPYVPIEKNIVLDKQSDLTGTTIEKDNIISEKQHSKDSVPNEIVLNTNVFKGEKVIFQRGQVVNLSILKNLHKFPGKETFKEVDSKMVIFQFLINYF